MDFNGKVGQCTVVKDKSIDDKLAPLAVVSYRTASEEDERPGVAGEDMTVAQRTGARCFEKLRIDIICLITSNSTVCLAYEIETWLPWKGPTH
jgi:hypothetical protein